MFTGIINDVGEITKLTHRGDTRFVISCSYDVAEIKIGASIACSGICLTVVDKGADGGKGGKGGKDGNWFAVEASVETLSASTASDWALRDKLNLERALKLGDELGGHMVLGHVDGIATVRSITAEGSSKRFVFAAPADLMGFIAAKGSVTLDGTSLTVNEVSENIFGVNLIPHTLATTSWGQMEAGARVNLEIDVLARYVARLRSVEGLKG